MSATDWSVLLQIPGADVMEKSMVASIIPEMVVQALGNGGRSWPSRGWSGHEQFHSEFCACLDSSASDWVCIARAQTQDEAYDLKSKLEELMVQLV